MSFYGGGAWQDHIKSQVEKWRRQNKGRPLSKGAFGRISKAAAISYKHREKHQGLRKPKKRKHKKDKAYKKRRAKLAKEIWGE